MKLPVKRRVKRFHSRFWAFVHACRPEFIGKAIRWRLKRRATPVETWNLEFGDHAAPET
jgi:hypothetical protein